MAVGLYESALVLVLVLAFVGEEVAAKQQVELLELVVVALIGGAVVAAIPAVAAVELAHHPLHRASEEGAVAPAGERVADGAVEEVAVYGLVAGNVGVEGGEVVAAEEGVGGGDVVGDAVDHVVVAGDDEAVAGRHRVDLAVGLAQPGARGLALLERLI